MAAQKEYITAPSVERIKKDVFFSTFGNHTRMELKNSMFAKGKLAILLQKFDQNNKQTDVITLYIDLPKALVMANDILSGRYAKMAGNSDSICTVFEDLGGMPPIKAKRPDRKALFRKFSIQKGRLWIFKGESGPGKVTDTGGFAPDGEMEHSITVGVSDETLKEIAMMVQYEYIAYRTAQMVGCDYA